MATTKTLSYVHRDGTLKRVELPCHHLPTTYLTDKWWVEDGYLYFTGPHIWNHFYYNTVVDRGYTHDVRVICWDVPDWKEEWGRYSNHHHYFDIVRHMFRAKILVQTAENIFHIKHCVVTGRPPKRRYR